MLKSKLLLSGFLASSLGFSYTPSANAGNFALTCIGTESNYPITFQVRWGPNRSWSELLTVYPGHWKLVTWDYAYAGQDTSPQLQIRYDDDPTSGVNYVISNLDSYAANYQDCDGQGKRYNFQSTEYSLVIVGE